MRKTIGNACLTFDELREVLLDVEIALNGRPLSYVEDDAQLPVLTPYSMLFSQPNILPERKAYHEENTQLRRRAKYLKRYKEAIWNRWTKEYNNNNNNNKLQIYIAQFPWRDDQLRITKQVNTDYIMCCIKY